MSCNVTAGRLEACKDQIGGLKAIYVINSGSNDLSYFIKGLNQGDQPLTPRNSSGSNISGSLTAFKFELKGNNLYETEIISSRENGTTYEQKTLSIELKGLEYQLFNTITSLSKGRFVVGVEPRSQNYSGGDIVYLMGTGHYAGETQKAKIGLRYAEVTNVDVTTGASMGDFTGAKVTIVANDDCGSDESGHAFTLVNNLNVV